MSTATIPQALAAAMQYHQAGRLAEAEGIYRQILGIQPANADALHLLGVIASQVGQHESAVDLIRRAIHFDPEHAAANINLGNALRALGRMEEAAGAYRRAIHIQPDFAEAHNNLGATLKDQGQLDEAIGAYRMAIQSKPDYAEAYSNLGVALSEQQRFDEAVASCRRALELQPEFAEAHYNLGNALRDLGRRDEATACYRNAVHLRPKYALAWNNWGNLLESRACFDEAAATYRRGIELNPDSAALHNNLGNMFKDLGRLDEALACIRQAMKLAPQSAGIHSNFLAILQYCPETTLAGLFEAHCEFDRVHAAPLRATWKPHRNLADAERPLRIGMVSPHFAFHPVGHFLIRLLENLDRRQFEVIGYSDTRVNDAMSARLRVAMTDWRDTFTLSDEQLTERIREDRVDILFDLAGHTAGNRLLVFARKPAPVQITWLDYVGTTGLSAMDWIIGDPREIPPEAGPSYREKVLRMPDDYICFEPPADAPEVGPLPAFTNGHVTFASFNIPPKTTPEIVRVWARILEAVPDARLILKNRRFDDPATQARYREIFAGRGVAGRVEFLGWSPTRELLAHYNRADIALDTFPYHGGLTTCESLWMGVPVITCPGETFAGRHGLAHLTAAGVPETIARDLDHYAEIAVKLASDLPALAAMRGGLRARVEASPLCDGRRFAGHFAVLLRDAWRQWCGQSR